MSSGRTVTHKDADTDGYVMASIVWPSQESNTTKNTIYNERTVQAI